MRIADIINESGNSHEEDPFTPVDITGRDDVKYHKQLKNIAIAHQSKLYGEIHAIRDKLDPQSVDSGGACRNRGIHGHEQEAIKQELRNKGYLVTPGQYDWVAIPNTPQNKVMADKWASLSAKWEKASSRNKKADLDAKVARKRKMSGGVVHELEFTTDRAKIPDMLPTMIGAKPSITNPYTICQRKYAGDPEKHAFTPTYKQYYDRIQAALKRNGLPPLVFMYGGFRVFERTGANGDIGQRNCLNFMIYTQEGDFAWRRWDDGGQGTGQCFYVNGVKQPEYLATTSDPKKQDKYLEEWFPEHFKNKK